MNRNDKTEYTPPTTTKTIIDGHEYDEYGNSLNIPGWWYDD